MGSGSVAGCVGYCSDIWSWNDEDMGTPLMSGVLDACGVALDAFSLRVIGREWGTRLGRCAPRAPRQVRAPWPPRAELASAPAATDALTEEERLASVLAGAPERIRAAVGRLTAMGVLGEDGKLLTQELPQDMRADSQTTVED